MRYVKGEAAINESLCCPICRCPLVEPVELEACRHVFCSTCINRALEAAPGSEGHCPIDRSSVTGIKPASYIIKALVDELLVYCPNRKRDCSWTGPRDTLASHTRQCCHKKVKKPSSAAQILSKARHEEASEPPGECPHCRDAVPADRTLVQHSEECDEVLVACENERFGCTVHASRRTIRDLHLPHDCPFEPLKPFFVRLEERCCASEHDAQSLRRRCDTIEASLSHLCDLLSERESSPLGLAAPNSISGLAFAPTNCEGSNLGRPELKGRGEQNLRPDEDQHATAIALATPHFAPGGSEASAPLAPILPFARRSSVAATPSIAHQELSSDTHHSTTSAPVAISQPAHKSLPAAPVMDETSISAARPAHHQRPSIDTAQTDYRISSACKTGEDILAEVGKHLCPEELWHREDARSDATCAPTQKSPATAAEAERSTDSAALREAILQVEKNMHSALARVHDDMHGLHLAHRDLEAHCNVLSHHLYAHMGTQPKSGYFPPQASFDGGIVARDMLSSSDYGSSSDDDSPFVENLDQGDLLAGRAPPARAGSLPNAMARTGRFAQVPPPFGVTRPGPAAWVPLSGFHPGPVPVNPFIMSGRSRMSLAGSPNRQSMGPIKL